MNDPENNINNGTLPTGSNESSLSDSLATNDKKGYDKESGEDHKPVTLTPKTIKSRVEDLFRSPLLTNLLLAGLFSNNLLLFYHDYETSHRFSSLLMMIQVCCVVLFFIVRIAPTKVSMKPMDWTIAILGACLPMLISPVSADNEVIILMLTQFFGIFISIVAIISLNTSFAVVPALRNIKTSGLYSLIRHPIYFSYFLTFTCIVLQNFSLYNLIILIAIYAADIYRITAEELVLSEDPQYELYKMRVRYRLLPFLW